MFFAGVVAGCTACTDPAGADGGAGQVENHPAGEEKETTDETNNPLKTPDRVAVHDPAIFWETGQDGKPIYYLFGTHITAAGEVGTRCIPPPIW